MSDALAEIRQLANDIGTVRDVAARRSDGDRDHQQMLRRLDQWRSALFAIEAKVEAKAVRLSLVEQEKADRDVAFGYLSRLFERLAPQCRASDKFSILVTQIDNYIAGQHQRAEAAESRCEALEQEKDKALRDARTMARADQRHFHQCISLNQQLDDMTTRCHALEGQLKDLPDRVKAAVQRDGVASMCDIPTLNYTVRKLREVLSAPTPEAP